MSRPVLRLAVVFLLGVAVGVWTNGLPLVGSAGVADVSAQGRSVGDTDRDDSDDNSFMGILNRLWSVGNILMSASSRLDAIDAVMGNPPDDSRPELQAALDDITFQCAMIEATTAAIGATR